MKKAVLNGYVSNFSVDYNTLDVSDIVDTHLHLMKNKQYKIILWNNLYNIKSFSRSLDCVVKVSDCKKCIYLNNGPSLVRPTLIDLNSNELNYYPLMVSLERCNGSCNTLDNLSNKRCVANKLEDVNFNVYMITGIN